MQEVQKTLETWEEWDIDDQLAIMRGDIRQTQDVCLSRFSEYDTKIEDNLVMRASVCLQLDQLQHQEEEQARRLGSLENREQGTQKRMERLEAQLELLMKSPAVATPSGQHECMGKQALHEMGNLKGQMQAYQTQVEAEKEKMSTQGCANCAQLLRQMRAYQEALDKWHDKVQKKNWSRNS